MRASILICLLLLASCTREAWRIPMAPARPDSVPAQPLVFGDGKYKFSGPVTITMQQGQGNTSTSSPTNNRKAGQKRGTAATGTGSTASSKPTGTAWWISVLFLLAGSAAGYWVRGK